MLKQIVNLFRKQSVSDEINCPPLGQVRICPHCGQAMPQECTITVNNGELSDEHRKILEANSESFRAAWKNGRGY